MEGTSASQGRGQVFSGGTDILISLQAGTEFIFPEEIVL